jgi:hypothetical protein
MRKYIIAALSIVLFIANAHAQEQNKANISSIRYNNKVIKAFKLNDWRDFSENLCAVKYKKKWGFIDKTKKVVIDFRYKDVGHFSEGLCDVVTDSGCAYINKQGEEVIRCYKFADNTPFIHHIAVLTDKSDRNYFINKKGVIISGPMDGYKDFDRSGFGAIGFYYNKQKDTLHYILIDTTGKPINNSSFIDIGKWDSYGHLIVLDSSYHVRWLTRQGDFFGDAFNKTAFALYTLYNSKDWTYKFEKDDIWFANVTLENDLLPVTFDNRQYGFINMKTKTLAIDYSYFGARLFHGGLAAVRNSSNKWGFIDKSGNVVINCVYNLVHLDGFKDGIKAKVKNDYYEDWWWIDKTGAKLDLPREKD